MLRGPERRAVGPAVSVHTGLSADVAFSLLSLSRSTPRYNGNVFSSNVLFVMSLMEESANAELQGRPGGARRYARCAAGRRREDHRRTGGRGGRDKRARQHLNPPQLRA